MNKKLIMAVGVAITMGTANADHLARRTHD